MGRKAKITRKTKETSISVAVNLDGKGKYKVKASAVEPANPAITPLFSIFLTFLALLFKTVLPRLT